MLKNNKRQGTGINVSYKTLLVLIVSHNKVNRVYRLHADSKRIFVSSLNKLIRSHTREP